MSRAISWAYADYGDDSASTGVATPEQYGAAGDGVTTDTAAFYTASYNCQRLVLTPGKVYKIPGFKLRNGFCIEAAGGTDYTGIHPYILPKLIGDINQSGFILDVSNQGDPNYGRAITLRGVVIDGIDQSVNGISSGSAHLNGQDIYITNCNNGFGGVAPAGSAYTRGAVLENLTVTSSIVGARDFIDSRLTSPLLAGNQSNLKAQAGANSNQVNGGRIEWGTQYNILLDASGSGNVVSDWRFNGTEVDRGGYAGIYLSAATHIQLNGMMHRRAGAINDGVAGHRSQIYCDSCDDILIVNPRTGHGFDDGGGGSDTPLYFAEFNNNNSNVIIVGGNVATAGTFSGSMIRYNSGLSLITMPGHKIIGVGGLEDYSQGTYLKLDGTGIAYQSRAALNTSSLPHGGTANATVTLSQYPTATFDRNTVVMTVTVRGATSGNTRTARFTLSTKRESAASSIDASPAYGEVGTSGAIGVGSGTLAQLVIQNVATDGSTFDINVTNKSATEDIAVKIVIQ